MKLASILSLSHPPVSLGLRQAPIQDHRRSQKDGPSSSLLPPKFYSMPRIAGRHGGSGILGPSPARQEASPPNLAFARAIARAGKLDELERLTGKKNMKASIPTYCKPHPKLRAAAILNEFGRGGHCIESLAGQMAAMADGCQEESLPPLLGETASKKADLILRVASVLSSRNGCSPYAVLVVMRPVLQECLGSLAALERTRTHSIDVLVADTLVQVKRLYGVAGLRRALNELHEFWDLREATLETSPELDAVISDDEWQLPDENGGFCDDVDWEKISLPGEADAAKAMACQIRNFWMDRQLSYHFLRSQIPNGNLNFQLQNTLGRDAEPFIYGLLSCDIYQQGEILNLLRSFPLIEPNVREEFIGLLERFFHKLRRPEDARYQEASPHDQLVFHLNNLTRFHNSHDFSLFLFEFGFLPYRIPLSGRQSVDVLRDLNASLTPPQRLAFLTRLAENYVHLKSQFDALRTKFEALEAEDSPVEAPIAGMTLDEASPEELAATVARLILDEQEARNRQQALELIRPRIGAFARQGVMRHFVKGDLVIHALRSFGFTAEAAAKWAAWGEFARFHSGHDALLSFIGMLAAFKEMPLKRARMVGRYLSEVMSTVPASQNGFADFMPFAARFVKTPGVLIDSHLSSWREARAAYADEEGRLKSRGQVAKIRWDRRESSRLLETQVDFFRNLLSHSGMSRHVETLFSDNATGREFLQELSTAGMLTHLMTASLFMSEEGQKRIGRLVDQLYESKLAGRELRYDELGRVGFAPEFIAAWQADIAIPFERQDLTSDFDSFLAGHARQIADHDKPISPAGTPKSDLGLPDRVTALREEMRTAADPSRLAQTATALLQAFESHYGAIRKSNGDLFASLRNDLRNLLNGLKAYIELQKGNAGSSLPRRLNLVVSGQPILFARVGSEPMPTCQRMTDLYMMETNGNGQPVSRMLHGQFKVLTVQNGDSILARTMLEVSRDDNGAPHLLVERFYMAPEYGNIPEMKERIVAYARDILGIPVERVHFEDKEKAPKPLHVEDLVYRDTYR